MPTPPTKVAKNEYTTATRERERERERETTHATGVEKTARQTSEGRNKRGKTTRKRNNNNTPSAEKRHNSFILINKLY